MDEEQDLKHRAATHATLATLSALMARLAAERPDAEQFIVDVWGIAKDRIDTLVDVDAALYRATADSLHNIFAVAETEYPTMAELLALDGSETVGE